MTVVVMACMRLLVALVSERRGSLIFRTREEVLKKLTDAPLFPVTLVVVSLLACNLSLASSPPSIISDWTYDTGGDDWLLACVVGSQGNVYVTGTCDLGSNRNIRTMKYAPNGTVEFNVSFDTGDDDHVSDVALDGDSNVYLAAESYQGDDYDTCVIKYDSQGNYIWHMMSDLGGIDRAQDIATDPDGFLHIVGEKDGSVNTDLYLMKATVDGDTAWTRTYDSGFEDWGPSVGLDAWGNGYIGGNVDADTLTVTRVSRYNWNGDIAWTSILQSDYDEGCWDLAVDYDGNVYVAGYSCAGKEVDSRVTKYDTNGGQLWTRTYDSGFDDYIHGVTVDGAGAVIAGGGAYDKEGERLLLLKYDGGGNLLWASASDSAEHNVGFDVELDDGGFLYVAATSSNGTDHDFRTQIYQQYLTISGTVVDDRSGVEGVPVQLEGYYDLTDTTDANGNFLFLNVPCGNYYRVYPDVAGATFDPPEYEYLSLGYDRTDQDFEITLGAEFPNLREELDLSIVSPGTGTAAIEYSLPAECTIQLKILDLAGRVQETAFSGAQSEGNHRILWVPTRSGVFLARLETEYGSRIQRFVVIR